MDEMAKRLKSDAERIDVHISDELDRRISASLRVVGPEKPAKPARGGRPATFWWASSLTGMAATAAVIVVMNARPPLEETAAPPAPATAVAAVPVIDWKAETAMLTSPLRQELLDLKSDIKKAEQKVKDDIGL